VFYANQHFWPEKAAFPGMRAVKSQGVSGCGKQFVSYTGLPKPDSAYSRWMILPLESANWDAGDRGLVCIAYSASTAHPNGYPVTGTIKGAGGSQQLPALLRIGPGWFGVVGWPTV
jgi:hypothetical protein